MTQLHLPADRTHERHRLENRYPGIWRASQLAHDMAATIHTGYIALNQELPNAGWPLGQLIEILIAQFGTAELNLLMPALKRLDHRPVALLAPPHIPFASAYQQDAAEAVSLLWIAGTKHSDHLWSAEQILKNGSCGALLLWQKQIKTEVLRRLHLLAQKSQTLFFVIRPMQAAQSPSPAVLRIALTPKASGMQINILKRRGASNEAPLFLYTNDHPYLSSRVIEPLRQSVPDSPLGLSRQDQQKQTSIF
ncbi:translesion DNA synthesis-associated protein ImuA [Undibacterium sp. RuRC25W]|uniref:translesion DNA synthesis-associated protein ImuA n=1 Tax=Undibacterium sp. RuRC25W TaxID=3413047 RepID=UPI003BF45D2D